MKYLMNAFLIGGLLLQPMYSSPEESRSLKILLTNDDGWSAIGIRLLKTALKRAGHEVVVVAPNMNYSGTSAMLTRADPEVEELEDLSYSVSASPATCVLLGLTAIYTLEEPPDLVVSGINHGANLGPAISFSGTVGAATMALTFGIPAIAVSADPIGKPGEDPSFIEHYERVADFTARFINRISQNQSGLVLPSGSGLNLNYPPLVREKVQGIRMSVQGRSTEHFPGFLRTEDGNYLSLLVELNQDDPSESDVANYNRGFITVMPFNNDRSLGGAEFKSLNDSLSDLSP